jgi:hypothetical protein
MATLLTLVIVSQLCAAQAQSAGATLGRPIVDDERDETVDPVVLGWPEFESAQRPTETVPAPRQPELPSTRTQATVADVHSRQPDGYGPSNLGELARTITRRLPADNEFDAPLQQVESTEPWIVPSGNDEWRAAEDYEVGLQSQSPAVSAMPGPVADFQTDANGVQTYVANCPQDCWTHQLLPEGLLFHSFLAGEKEPRFGTVWLNDPDRGMVWETALGARVGILRYGTEGAINPEGWQLDLEGGVLTRLDPEVETDVDAMDFVIGILGTRRVGRTAIEFGYGHLSSHVGDEYLVKHPTFRRVNYVRDSLLFGLSYDVTPDVRVYGEIAYAPGAQGGAKPLEAQFGSEYSPARPYFAPFAAINAHYREDFGFQFSINVEAGVQLRGPTTNRLIRIGVQHYNGKSLQYEFFDEYETLTGAGMWVDF